MSACRRFQKTITLPNHKRGCHVVTRKLLAELPELGEYEVGLANLFSECTKQQQRQRQVKQQP
jgi:hypothetical protein